MEGSGRAFPTVEAERAVLGGLMLDPERMGTVAEHVGIDDFYAEAHQSSSS